LPTIKPSTIDATMPPIMPSDVLFGQRRGERRIFCCGIYPAASLQQNVAKPQLHRALIGFCVS